MHLAVSRFSAGARGFVHNAVVTSSTILSGGAKLAVTMWGAGGVPVVALHPGVGDRRIWQQCAPSWVNAGHVVVAYDRRGFGATTAVEEPHDDVADLLAVIAA